MKLNLTKTDIRDCEHYFALRSCLLSTACKRRFKTEDVCASGHGVRVAGVRYNLSDEDATAVSAAYDAPGGIRKAKPFTITLTRQP